MEVAHSWVRPGGARVVSGRAGRRAEWSEVCLRAVTGPGRPAGAQPVAAGWSIPSVAPARAMTTPDRLSVTVSRSASAVQPAKTR